MHSLARCKLCSKIFDPASVLGGRGICLDCYRKLDSMYSVIHDFIRDHKEEARFDPVYLSKMTKISLDNVKLLISMGYLERDMQTWGSVQTERGVLAKKFARAIERSREDQKLIATYGGHIYNREKQSQ